MIQLICVRSIIILNINNFFKPASNNTFKGIYVNILIKCLRTNIINVYRYYVNFQ